MIKDFDEYQVGAIRTMKPDDYVKSVVHCIMGMSGEIGEFAEIYGFNYSCLSMGAREMCIGEVGDCFWYCASLCQQFGVSMEEVRTSVLQLEPEWKMLTPLQLAIVTSARLVDIAKKAFFYDKPIQIAQCLPYLTWYIQALEELCDSIAVTPLEAADRNLAKLKARYPGKFNADDAINRDYSKESEAAGIQIV